LREFGIGDRNDPSGNLEKLIATSALSAGRYSVLSPPFAFGGVVTPLLPLSGAPPRLRASDPPTVGGQGIVGADKPGPQVPGLAVVPLLAAPPNDPAPCEVPLPGWVGAASQLRQLIRTGLRFEGPANRVKRSTA